MKHDERRRDARVTPSGLRARVRTGHALSVVNVSASGALVEGGSQLRPGSRIDVHFERDEGRRMVQATVSRCSVSRIDARAGVLYRAALYFVERCDWVRENATPEG